MPGAISTQFPVSASFDVRGGAWREREPQAEVPTSRRVQQCGRFNHQRMRSCVDCGEPMRQRFAGVRAEAASPNPRVDKKLGEVIGDRPGEMPGPSTAVSSSVDNRLQPARSIASEARGGVKATPYQIHKLVKEAASEGAFVRPLRLRRQQVRLSGAPLPPPAPRQCCRHAMRDRLSVPALFWPLSSGHCVKARHSLHPWPDLSPTPATGSHRRTSHSLPPTTATDHCQGRQEHPGLLRR